jgi:hypothetical protein
VPPEPVEYSKVTFSRYAEDRVNALRGKCVGDKVATDGRVWPGEGIGHGGNFQAVGMATGL